MKNVLLSILEKLDTAMRPTKLHSGHGFWFVVIEQL